MLKRILVLVLLVAVLFSVNIDVVPVVYAEGPASLYEGGWGGRSGALPLSGETVRFSDTNILEMWRYSDNYWRFERLIGGRLVGGQVHGERVARSITELQHAFVGTGDVTFIFNLPSNVINGIRDTRVRMGNPNFVPVARFDLRTDSQELLRSHGREHLGTLDISDIVESWNNPDYHIDLVAGTIELHFRPRFNFVTDPVTDLPIELSSLVGGVPSDFVPVVDGRFGHNLFSVFDRAGSNLLDDADVGGGARFKGYFNEFNPSEMISGRIHPSIIQNGQGHLAAGHVLRGAFPATFEDIGIDFPSESVQIGGGSSFGGGSAVGVGFLFPLEITFFLEHPAGRRDDPTVPPAITPERHDIHPWRLTRFWHDASELVDPPLTEHLTAESWLEFIPSGRCLRGKTYTFTPQGSVTFEMTQPRVSVPWFRSRVLLSPFDTLVRTITKYANLAMIRVFPDLLAIKENGNIDNLRTATWVSGNPNLSSFGIGTTNRGAPVAFENPRVEEYVLDPGITNPTHYTYIRLDANCRRVIVRNADGSSSVVIICNCRLVPCSVGEGRTTADYVIRTRFVRHEAMGIRPRVFEPVQVVRNGFASIAAQSPTPLFVNPEVFMIFADTLGRDHGAVVAADYLREIRPVSYHTLTYTARVNPNVVGASTGVSVNAHALARRLGAGGRQVVHRGSTITAGFDNTGQLITRSFILDIGNQTVRGIWNPGTTYNPVSINNDFMSQFATFNATTSRWIMRGTANMNSKVANTLGYGVQNGVSFNNTRNTVLEHSLLIRGGRLAAVNGDFNFRVTLRSTPAGVRLLEALENMRLTTSGNDSVLNVFERNTGTPVHEDSFVSLGNTARGTSDLRVNAPWYNEDSTVLVVREFVQEFEVPDTFFSTRLRLSYPGLASPTNKNLFYTVGATGHVVMSIAVNSNRRTLNPYMVEPGVVRVFMEHDSSTGGDFGPRTIDYIVPNVSVMDTHW